MIHNGTVSIKGKREVNIMVRGYKNPKLSGLGQWEHPMIYTYGWTNRRTGGRQRDEDGDCKNAPTKLWMKTK